MQAETFVQTFGERRVSAILRCFDTELAAAAMERAISGGFEIIEFTLSIPGALDLIQEFSARDDVIVGAGTVLTEAEARSSIAAGAAFLVSPVVDEAVIGVAGDAGIASIPGANTPTEMMRAHQAGAPLIKLFPAPAGGPAWVRSLLGPLPFLKVVPTNGVDVDNLSDWLAAGVYGVGFATTLFRSEDLNPEGLGRIEERARAIVAQIDSSATSASNHAPADGPAILLDEL